MIPACLTRRSLPAMTLVTLLLGSWAILLCECPSNAQGPNPAARSYARAILESRPVAYWRLGESQSAALAADASGHRHNGMYHGKPHCGQPGAIAFDGDTALGLDGPKTKSYVEVADSAEFSVAGSGQGLTVEVWLRPDELQFPGENTDPGNAYIHWLGKGEKGAYEWGLRFYNAQARRPSRISAYIWNLEGKEGAGAYFEDKLIPHQWIYIAATFDDPHQPNARVQIFKNGEPSRHNSSPGALYQGYRIGSLRGHAPVRLGTRDLRGFLTGGLDEVAIYPRVLDPAEIKAHWLRATRGS